MKQKKALEVIYDKKVSLKLKEKFYYTVIKSTLLYSTDYWAIKREYEQNFNLIKMRMLQWMSDHIRK